jgi:hypothetical protein
MRNVLSAILLSTFAISAPAFAGHKKAVAEGTTAAPVEQKQEEGKSSAPASDTKTAHPRKVKKARTTKTAEKAPEVKSEKPVEAAPVK